MVYIRKGIRYRFVPGVHNHLQSNDFVCASIYFIYDVFITESM
jgi:hypothetical protein